MRVDRAVAAVALLLLLAVPLADAHASRAPGSETPAAGSRLASIPAEISLVVTEPVSPDGTFLRVTRSDGVRVDVGGTRIQDAATASPRLSVSVRSDAGDGAYTVTLQTLSTADGHPWTESFGFAVGDFEPPVSSSAGRVPIDAATGRFLTFAGLSLGLGAALFLAWMPGSGARWNLRFVHEPLLGAGILHTAGLLLLIHATSTRTGLDLVAFAATDVGRLLIVRLILGVGALVLAALAFSPRTRTTSGPWAACGLLLLAALGSSRLGHASLAGVPGVAVDFLHLLAAATWVGGLAVLLWVLSNAAGHLTVTDVRRIGLRFGTAALVCVVLLAAAGLAATAIIVGPALWTDPLAVLASPWGWFLAAKVALTVAMLLSAAANRLVFLETPRDTGVAGIVQRLAGKAWGGLRSLDALADARGLRRVVAVEAALGLLVLGLAGALTAVSPPTDGDVEPGPLALTGSGNAHHVALTLDPAPTLAGSSDLRLVVQTHEGVPVTADTCGRTGCITVTLRYGNGTAEGGETRAFAPDGDGGWTLDDLLWTQAGSATLLVRIQTAEVFEDIIEMPLFVA